MPVLLISFLTFSILSSLGGQISSVGAQLFPLGYGASLTGDVDDKGVDTDGDGLFDYLQISVEVNITFPWILYNVEVSKLLDHEDSSLRYIHVQQSEIVYPETGIQLVNLSVYGPMIYNSGLDPEKIYQITLSETYPEYSSYFGFNWYTDVIDTISNIPLSREYSYMEFDPPVTNVEAKFVVYPDGRVVIGGGLNSTPTMSPFVGMPSLKDLVMQGDVSLMRTGLRTVISQNSTVLLSPEYASKFPLNSTTMSMLETYSADVFDTRTNCTVILPSYITSKVPFNSTDASLSVTYSDGLFTTEIGCSTTVPTTFLPFDFEVPSESEQLFDFVCFLLNSTDVSIVGEYQSGELSGNMTISMLPGFALGNLDLAFQGNQTNLSLSGNIRVLYGSFYGLELSEENLDMILLQLNSIQGTGSGSLYEMTNGVLECTKLNATKTPITDPSGSEVDFEVDIHGDFLEAFANAILSLYLSPYVPPEEREQLQTLMYSALNTTLCSVQTTSFELGYTHSTRQASMEFTFVDDVQSLVDGFLPLVPQIHPSIPETLPDILNKTFSCTKTASVQMTYTKTDGRFAFETTAVAEDLEQVREEVTQLIVETLQNVTLMPLEIMPTEIRMLVESLLNTTYCSLESYESSLTYENGRQEVRETYTIRDDLNAELNHVKDIYLQYMLAQYSRYHMPVPWQHSFINQTEIDIRSLTASYNFTETLMKGSIDGLGLWAPIDIINSTRFQLRRFLNLASEMSPYDRPRKGEKFKITIEGGSNLTHSIVLFAPATVPEPDETASDRSRMIWYNQTPNSVMDMMFDIEVKSGVGEFEIAHPEFVSEANPYIANATENVGTVIEITGISKPAKLYVANLTEPPEGVEPPPNTYKVLGKYVYIQCIETDVNVNATIRMDYTPEQLSEMELDEETLKIHCWNATLGVWVPIETHVNTSEHYAWATISHFSIWALMGQPSAALIWSEPLFWILIVAIGLVITAAAYALMKKRR
ncbi:MAG: hypothetical protein OEX77_02975 [Candidatus Bathyarchaeota archaeon]|nr:hypothetical protein [Candidatus Bathyarchaeota archaeon]